MVLFFQQKRSSHYNARLFHKDTIQAAACAHTEFLNNSLRPKNDVSLIFKY